MTREIKLTYEGNEFVCRVPFEKRYAVKKVSGFRFDRATGRWLTSSPLAAARLREYADESAEKALSRTLLLQTPWSGPLSFPKHLTPYPFQLEAVEFALSRNRAYLALDPGLGKTIIAMIIANTLELVKPTAVLYICPSPLTRNTEAEFLKWSTAKTFAERYEYGKMRGRFCIVPDSIIIREETQDSIREFVKEQKRHGREIVLFVDEAHRYKNLSAKRTKAALQWVSKFDRAYFMSGTSMPNARPMELFPILKTAAAETIDFADKFEFGRKFCAAFHNDYGWDFTGASNIEEFAERTKPFMLRMKKDVLGDLLPSKIEEMIILSDDMSAKLTALDRRMLAQYSPEDLTRAKIANEQEVDELHQATYRRLLGIEKAVGAAAYVQNLLVDSDEPIIVFAIHKEVIATLAGLLAKYNPFVITGDTPMGERHRMVQEFQSDPSRKLIIGNIKAMGEGLTLTKAALEILAEFDWVPGANDQAMGRAHRIGQTKTVTAQYLVYRNSFDRAVLESNFRKREIINRYEREQKC